MSIKWPVLRSVIFCTEDAVALGELEFALENLAVCLLEMSIESRLLRFVRVRNPAVMAQVLAMPGVDKLDGFVFPKVTQNKLDEYFNPLVGSKFLTIVTLETVRAYTKTHPANTGLVSTRGISETHKFEDSLTGKSSLIKYLVIV